MNKRILLAGAAVASFAIPAAAQAQDAGSSAEPFVGVSVGYHDLGVDSDIADGLTGVEINDFQPDHRCCRRRGFPGFAESVRRC